MKYLPLIALLVVGCTPATPAVDREQQAKQEASLREANRQIGMPNIINFQELKLMKRIYELRDRADLVTYTYVVDMAGVPHFLTKSIGFGLPYATQLSNPEKRISDNIGGYYNLPQAEPNGLYMPSQAEGTWIMAIDPSGETHPMYVEPRVIVSPFPLGEK